MSALHDVLPIVLALVVMLFHARGVSTKRTWGGVDVEDHVRGVSGRRTWGGVDVEDQMQARRARVDRDGTLKLPSRAQAEKTVASRFARREALHGLMGPAPAHVDSHEELVTARLLLEFAARELDEQTFARFILRAEGHTFQEIAELVGDSEDAVRKRLSRASARLQRLAST
ncbi:MAG: sigma factor-like helix-turn-helix DNA-binding protein [Myxococcota bacterium]